MVKEVVNLHYGRSSSFFGASFWNLQDEAMGMGYAMYRRNKMGGQELNHRSKIVQTLPWDEYNKNADRFFNTCEKDKRSIPRAIFVGDKGELGALGDDMVTGESRIIDESYIRSLNNNHNTTIPMSELKTPTAFQRGLWKHNSQSDTAVVQNPNNKNNNFTIEKTSRHRDIYFTDNFKADIRSWSKHYVNNDSPTFSFENDIEEKIRYQLLNCDGIGSFSLSIDWAREGNHITLNKIINYIKEECPKTIINIQLIEDDLLAPFKLNQKSNLKYFYAACSLGNLLDEYKTSILAIPTLFDQLSCEELQSNNNDWGDLDREFALGRSDVAQAISRMDLLAIAQSNIQLMDDQNWLRHHCSSSGQPLVGLGGYFSHSNIISREKLNQKLWTDRDIPACYNLNGIDQGLPRLKSSYQFLITRGFGKTYTELQRYLMNDIEWVRQTLCNDLGSAPTAIPLPMNQSIFKSNSEVEYGSSAVILTGDAFRGDEDGTRMPQWMNRVKNDYNQVIRSHRVHETGLEIDDMRQTSELLSEHLGA